MRIHYLLIHFKHSLNTFTIHTHYMHSLYAFIIRIYYSHYSLYSFTIFTPFTLFALFILSTLITQITLLTLFTLSTLLYCPLFTCLFVLSVFKWKKQDISLEPTECCLMVNFCGMICPFFPGVFGYMRGNSIGQGRICLNLWPIHKTNPAVI